MTTDTEGLNQYSSASLDQDRRGARSQNMSETERWVSLVIGGGLLAFGLKQGIREGLMLAVTGGALLYRGATGQCPLYKVAGIDTSTVAPASANASDGTSSNARRHDAMSCAHTFRRNMSARSTPSGRTLK